MNSLVQLQMLIQIMFIVSQYGIIMVIFLMEIDMGN